MFTSLSHSSYLPPTTASLTLRTCTRVDACMHACTWTYVQLSTRVDVRGRMSLQLLILRDTARYCVKSQQKSRNTTHNRAEFDLCVRGRACTCVAAISVSAVIEISVHVRSVSEAVLGLALTYKYI